MLSFPPSVWVFLAVEPIDMRKGVDALANVVRNVIRQEPMSGHLFVFRGRRGHMLRVLYWDRTGWALYSKRLVRGTFERPHAEDGATRLPLDGAALAAYSRALISARRVVSGIALRAAADKLRFKTENLIGGSTAQR